MSAKLQGYSRVSEAPQNSDSRTFNASPKGSDSGSFTDYSESFLSDDGSHSINHNSTHKPKPGNTQATKMKSNESTATTKKLSPLANLKSSSKASKASPRQSDSVTHRMLSARRNRVNNLKSKLTETNSELDALKQENKILRRHERLQEKALNKLDKDENEVAELLRKHSSEVNTLREQLRRYKTNARQSEKKCKQIDEELSCSRRQLRRMTALVEDGRLAERQDLTRSLARVEAIAEQNEHRAKELEAHVEHLKKNHRHEIGIERAHQREIHRELVELRQTCQQKDLQLKEKEKEMGIRYIYSNRVVRPPHKLNLSISSTPLPPPGSARQKAQRKKSDPTLTPRTRAKLYELQRLQNEQSRKENIACTHTDNTAVELADDKRLPSSDLHFRFGSQQETQSQSDMEKYEQERLRNERLLAEKETERAAAVEASNELKEQEWWKQASMEHREQEAIHSKEQLSRERQQREEEEERRGRRIEEQKADRLRQEEKQRKLEEQAKRDEQRRQDELREKDERLQAELAEQEKLKKERELAEQEETKKACEEAERLANTAAEKERRRQKDMLLAKLREMDNKAMSPINDAPIHSPYTFSKPVENLHNGLPALENVNIPYLERTRRKSLFEDDNEYRPTFGGAKRSTGSSNLFRNSPDVVQPASRDKSNLMAQLFGTNSNKSGEGDDTMKSKTRTREQSSTALFAGGSAILDDDIPPFSNKPHLLPRRQRHIATVHTGPTINAIDDIDDDVEELIL